MRGKKKIKHLDSTNAPALSYTRLSVCQVTKKSSDLGGEKGKWACVSMCRNVRQEKVERIFLNIILLSAFFFFPFFCLLNGFVLNTVVPNANEC